MSTIRVMAAISAQSAAQYQAELARHDEFSLRLVTDIPDARRMIAEQEFHVDVMVIDYNLGEVYDFIVELRQKYPRLLIVLVDDGADFGLPGQADEISVDPFTDDDLARRIKQMISDRRMETQRSDGLPAMRQIAQHMKKATGTLGKQEAAMQSVLEMGYDYVAYYQIENTSPLELSLRAHVGPNAIKSIAPKQATIDDLMGWVANNSQSRIAAPEDKPNHPLVARGRLGAIACVPVSFSERHMGVVAACRDQPGTITQENVLMLELVATQLAMAILKEERAS